ncbi:MAG: hypothetical protein LBJ16_01785 [Holosporaceae bacterium]|nr:hypothetical protein [Holosporaceae bacterium]
MCSFGNFCVASVLGSSCTTCTLRSCAPYAPINSSKYLCVERSLFHTPHLEIKNHANSRLGYKTTSPDALASDEIVLNHKLSFFLPPFVTRRIFRLS